MQIVSRLVLEHFISCICAILIPNSPAVAIGPRTLLQPFRSYGHRQTLFTQHKPPQFRASADYDDSGVPKAESLVNVDVTCDGWVGVEGSSSASSLCSDGYCLNGVFGVYCLCYVRESDLEEVG